MENNQTFATRMLCSYPIDIQLSEKYLLRVRELTFPRQIKYQILTHSEASARWCLTFLFNSH